MTNFATCKISCDLFTIAVLLREDAAAIFLHIEAEVAGFRLAFPEADAKIAVEEFDAGEGGEIFADFDELLVLLVGRYE